MKAYIIISLGVILISFMLIMKSSRFSIILLMVYMWFLYTFCNGGTPDLGFYVLRYEQQIYGTSVGYDMLMKIGSACGLSFTMFKAILGFLYVLFIYLAIKRCTKNVALVLALCLLLPFTVAIGQIRNGLMSVIVLYSLVVYTQSTKHSMLKYIIGILIAATIQPSAIFYLLFIFAKKSNKDSNKSGLWITIIMIMGLMIVIENNMLYEIAKTFITNPKYIVYFDFKTIMEETTTEVLNWKGKLSTFLLHAGGVFVFYKLYNYSRCGSVVDLNPLSDRKISGFSDAQLSMLQNVQWLSLAIVPYYLFNPTYFRLYYNIVPLIYIVYSQVRQLSNVGMCKKATVQWATMYVLLYSVVTTLFLAIGQGYVIETLDSFKIF